MHLLFSTPVWINEINNYENINQELKDFIYEEKEKNPKGTTKSNVKGWHSSEFDLKKSNLKNFISGISNNIEVAINDKGWDLETQIAK